MNPSQVDEVEPPESGGLDGLFVVTVEAGVAVVILG